MQHQFAQVEATPVSDADYGTTTSGPTPMLLPGPIVYDGPTLFGEQPRSFRRVGRSASSLEELRADPTFGRPSVPHIEESQDPVQRAQEHRLAILARKYEGTELTREDVARVAILTQRLRRLVPRVTAKSWTIAEESVDDLEQVSERIEQIRREFDL